MSLMLKLLTIALLLNSFAYANTSEDVEEFISEQLSKNPSLKSVDVNVDSIVKLDQLKDWHAYIVQIEAILKSKPTNVIKQKMIWFSDGNVITKDLTDMQTGESLSEKVKPNFKSKYYTKANLIYGNENAKHKIAIFSDPLCPFCKAYVPGAIKDMKKEPNKFALYYFHFPLVRLHPASVALVKAALVAEMQGVKDVILKLYKVKVNPNEKDVKKILTAFNKAVGTKITLEELRSKEVKKQAQYDLNVANDIMVAGTPTIYLDGKIDRTKKKYKKVK